MKKIDTSSIAGLAKAPFIADTHDHIKESVLESTAQIVKGLLNGYTTNDLIILYGCVVAVTGGSIPGTGTATLTAGAIYYNGEIYEVDANAGLATTNPQTLIWEVVTTYLAADSTLTWSDGTIRDLHQIDKLRLVAGTVGAGLADFDDATVKRLSSYTENSTSTVTYGTGWADAAGAGSTISLRSNGDVELNANIEISAGGTIAAITLPAWAEPAVGKRFTISDYNGTDGASVLMILDISGTAVTIYKQSDGTKPADRTTLTFTIRYNIYV